MNWLGEDIQREITTHDTVLDLGCGIMGAITTLKCKSILGVDIWDKYLDHIKHDCPTIKLDMSELDRFMAKSYDVVLCLDVIEHLPKELALQVLDDIKRICRKKAIIYTPIQFKINDQPEEGAWGMGECHYQDHKCLISRADLVKRKYKVKNPMEDGWYAIYTKR